MRTLYIYDVLAFLLWTIQLAQAYTCFPIETGDTAYMHCTVNGGNINDTLTWQFLLNGTYREVSTCSRGICKNPYPHLFKARIDYISEDGSVFQSTMTRFNQRRGNFLSTAKWECVHGAEYQTPVCEEILFYKPPDTASCSYPRLIDSNTAVAVTCIARGIFPQATCQWHLEGARVGVAIDILDLHDETGEQPVTFISTCTAVIQLSSISSGTYLLRVVISPGHYNWLGDLTTIETLVVV